MTFEQQKEAFRQYYDSNFGFLNDAAKKFKGIIEVVIENIPTDSIQERVKKRDECIKKFENKYAARATDNQNDKIQDYITDLIGIRIICLYESDTEIIKQLLEKNFDIVEETNKSEQLYNTNRFGYKGLHLDLRINSPRSELPEFVKYITLKFEVQIRTVTQHAWSAIEHKLRYKGQTQDDNLLERRINRLAALFEMADEEFVLLKTSLYESQPLSSLNELTPEETEETEGVEEVINEYEDKPFSLSYFLGYVRARFKDYPFLADKASIFVESILTYDQNYTQNSFKSAMVQNFRLVNQYMNNTGIKMNPYTILRHTLYYSDNITFKDILRHEQKLSFDEWLRDNGEN
jgi:putative GTP pyrophosphokinase